MGPRRKQMSPRNMIEKKPAKPLDEYDDYGGEPQACWECGGRGWKITCCDDMCHGQDECIHGDGESACSNCGGTGDEP